MVEPEEKTKGTWGGKRAGAGRPKDTETKHRISLSVTKKEEKALREILKVMRKGEPMCLPHEMYKVYAECVHKARHQDILKFQSNPVFVRACLVGSLLGIPRRDVKKDCEAAYEGYKKERIEAMREKLEAGEITQEHFDQYCTRVKFNPPSLKTTDYLPFDKWLEREGYYIFFKNERTRRRHK